MDEICHCGRNTRRRTSWTELNPGRRYTACQKFREDGGCNFFVWIDPPMCARARQIIPGLLKRVNNLEDELKRKGTIEDELKRKRSREKWLWGALVVSWIVIYLAM